MRQPIGLLLFLLLATGISPASRAETWYVDCAGGDDLTGTGTSTEPFKTLTRALEMADPPADTRDLVVAIAPAGSGCAYDEANGEDFPILMKPGVDLVGMGIPTLDGVRRPVIEGGATYHYVDDPERSRYTSVLGADDASISGFHLVGSDGPDGESGTSILCDGTSPLITSNQFSGDCHAGITTLGEAHPVVQENDFLAGPNWGMTLYGSSYPTVEGNTFSGANGLDATGDHGSRPTVEGNTFECDTVAISTKGPSQSAITGNHVSGGQYGVITRPPSSLLLQGNTIEETEVGVYVNLGVSADLGGGEQGSLGDNRFTDNDWDVQNYAAEPLMARNNRWSHGLCCETIDREDVYDDDESTMSGAVDFGPCLRCGAFERREPTGPPARRRENLFLIGCGPCPQCFEGFCDPRVNPEGDRFLIWDDNEEIAWSFDRSKLGLEATDGPILAASRVGRRGEERIFVISVPWADGKVTDGGALLFFDQSGGTVARVEGEIAGERLGQDLDVRDGEVVVLSTRRILRLRGTEVVSTLDLPTELNAGSAARVAFTADVDGDRRADVLLGAPHAASGSLPDAGRILVIGSRRGAVLDTLYGRSAGQRLGDSLQGIALGKVPPD